MENEIEDIVLSEEEEKEGIIIIVINLWLTEDTSVYLFNLCFWENSLTFVSIVS